MTVKEIFEKYAIAKKLETKATTHQSKIPKIEQHVLPFFADIDADKITSDQGIEWLSWLLDKGLSASYVNDIKIIFSCMLNWALDQELITKNQIRKLKKISDYKNKKNLNFWTVEEFNQFIEVVDDPLYNLFFYFLFYTGVRRGEAKALTWQDINLCSGQVSINKQIVKLKGNSQAITTPKTRSSNRSLFMHKDLIEKMLYHYKEMKSTPNFRENNLVFGNTKPLSNTTIDRILQHYINLSKVKKITLHGFRHSHASFMVHSLKTNVLTIADRLGHSDTQETLNTYSHLYQSEQKKLALDIEQIIINNQDETDEFNNFISELYISVQDYSNKHNLKQYEKERINAILSVLQF